MKRSRTSFLSAFACLLAASGLLPAAEEKVLPDAAGNPIIRYVIEVPEGLPPAGTPDPAKQVGLFLCFPEHDRPTGDEILPVREALKRQGLLDQYILLAGHPQERKFGPKDHEPIQKLIAWAEKTYPINPRRVYMYGKGEGGKISGEFAMMHPTLVTAAITYSWGWWTMPAETTRPIDMEAEAPGIYMVLGLRDLSYHLTTVRDTYSRVQAKGYPVIYREFAELGARTYHPPSNNDAVAWATRLRNKNVPLSRDEQQLAARAAKAASAPAAGYFTDLAVVGGAPAAAAIEKLLDSSNEAIRAAAARTFAHANFGEAAMAALGRKTVDSSPKVRRAAIEALALHANWRSQAAQKALIELATTPGRAVTQTDRVSAVDGLVRTIQFQINGVRQDPPVFRALVQLLLDEDQELKVMATNALAPVRDPDFRGDLGRKERQAPELGWEGWLEAITAKNDAYLHDYTVCGFGGHPADPSSLPGNRGRQEAEDLYCSGGSALLGYNLATGKPGTKDLAAGFQATLRAAQQNYVPAQALVGMLYAVGKGTVQNFPEAANWWLKAAEAGHVLAASNLSMIYRGGAGIKPDPELSKKWGDFAAAHASSGGQ